jgi:glycosyltransferase involved in cell wall biosynthesis
LHVDQVGRTAVSDRDRAKEAAVAVVTAPSAAPRFDVRPDFRVLAIMCAYNEVDVIAEAIRRLLDDGVEVHVVDNWSGDGTFEAVSRLAEQHPQLTVERFPAEGPTDTYDWKDLLQRVETLGAASGADWVLHHDADEYRTSPWSGVGLRAGLWAVTCAGYSAVDFRVIDHRPVDDDFVDGSDFVAHFRHFDFGDEAADSVQVKAWRNTGVRVRLADHGGHNATFPGRRIHPYRFELHHYSIRGERHGRRKVLRDRRARWNAAERAAGWHYQYEQVGPGHTFLRRPSELFSWDPADREPFRRTFVIERLTSLGEVAPSDPGASVVSVVLPVIDGSASLVVRQLELLAGDPTLPLELIFVNSASEAPTRAVVDQLRELAVVVDVEAGASTGRMWNAGAATANGQLLVFLRPGTLVADNWWPPLQQLLDGDTAATAGTVGVVGSMTIDGAGAVSSIGGAVVERLDDDGSATLLGAALGAGTDPMESLSGEATPTSILPGALLACRRRTYSLAGSFQESYTNDYETVDFSLAVRRTGASVMVHPASVVAYEPPERSIEGEPDAQQLTLRWHRQLVPDYVLDASGALHEAEASTR